MIVVKAKASGKPWNDVLVNLRVEDHDQPRVEVRGVALEMEPGGAGVPAGAAVVAIGLGVGAGAAALLRAGGAGRHAELATEARVVVDRLSLGGYRGLDEHGAEQNEVAELRVDDVAMDAHHTQTGGHRDGLVRDHADPARIAVHLHRERGRRIQRSMTGIL